MNPILIWLGQPRHYIVFFLSCLLLGLLLLQPDKAHGRTYYWNMHLTGVKIVHDDYWRNRGGETSVAVIDGFADCRHWNFMKWEPGVTGTNCSAVGLPGASFAGYSDHATHVASIIGSRGGQV